MRQVHRINCNYSRFRGVGLSIWNTNSPYVAAGVAAVLVAAFAAAVVVRYRHYGVYETHEDDQLVDDEDLLRNPVVVLDRNQESYVNLKYPVLVRTFSFFQLPLLRAQDYRVAFQ